MKRAVIYSLLITALCFSSALGETPTNSGAMTFMDCYRHAVNQSEMLLISQEDIEQAKMRRRQALGGILPDLRWLLTSTIQDTSGTGNESGGVGGTLTRRERTESKFQVKQPLFQGFKEFRAMQGYKAQERQQAAELMHDTYELYLNVATAFFRVVQLETFGQDLQVSINLTEERVEELNGRVRLGKSRNSEVLSSASQLASLQSQAAINQGNIVSARDVLGFFVGKDMRSVRLLDETPFPTYTNGEEDAVRLGLNRSDVRALQENVEAQRAAANVARASYYPYLNLLGNYYTKRPGFQSEIDWDLAFNVDVPIFQGGSVRALDLEARSRLKQAELDLARLMRLAESEIKQAHAALFSSINESNALEDAYLKAKRSYTAQVKEYRLGLVNNLDVLQALNSMQEMKARYDTSRLQAKLNLFKLRVVTEEMP